MRLLTIYAFLLFSVRPLFGQAPPFDPAAWPPTIDKTKTVHFKVVNDALVAPADATNWSDSSMTILSGGDQETTAFRVADQDGLRVTGSYLNIGDLDYAAWAEEPVIDILMQVYGDVGLFSAQGQPRNFDFRIGALPEHVALNGGQAPLEAKNFKWNWILFRVTNGQRGDGGRYVGTLPPGVTGDSSRGGINGGTIRMEGVPGFGVRAVALGPEGAFGSLEQINVFAGTEACQPEPETNHVWLDFAHNSMNHLVMLDDGDQLVDLVQNIGPVGDKRTVLQATGNLMNFGITDSYLGLKCNDPHPMKVCVEYYDDPALAGEKFGPEAFANDATTGVGFALDTKYQTLDGSGTWKRRSWVVGGVNLRGVNTGVHTGGPRLYFSKPVAVSRVDMAVIREGTHPLTGQDPLANCQTDPAVCEGLYGDYVEMDLANGTLEGLAPGTSNVGSDQEMIQAEAGPATDRRMAMRPAGNDGTPPHNHMYMNFALTDARLGPTSQPNVRLAVAVTYFDDPELAGTSFRPEVYRTEKADGTTTFLFAPASLATTLQGSNRWVESYVELDNLKFEGVNQGPQGAARFATTGKIFFSRVRYAVIRPCGEKAGQNLLAGAKPPISAVRDGGNLRLQWVAGQNWNLEFIDPRGGGTWQAVPDVPTVTDFLNVVELPVGDPPSRFYRLMKK